MKWAFTFIAGLLFFAIFLTPQYASTQTAEIAQRVSPAVELERKTQTRSSFDLNPLMTLKNSAGRALSANWSIPANVTTVNPAAVTLTGTMSPSSAIVGVTQVSLVGNATPGATVSETDVGPDGGTNRPFTTIANSSGTYTMGPFLLTQLGTYTGTLRDSISGQTKTITYGGTGDFSASVNTTSRTITAGQSTTYTVTFSSIGGFSGVVTPGALNWSNVPGATAFWSPAQVTVP